jgi:hypothetical protein
MVNLRVLNVILGGTLEAAGLAEGAGIKNLARLS